MPIPEDELTKDFVLADASEQLGAIRDRLPTNAAARNNTYIVWPLASGRYQAVYWKEIEALGRANAQITLANTLVSLPGLPGPVEAVEQNSMGLGAARDRRDAQPGKRLVVLRNGSVLGLFTREMRSAEDPQTDPFATHAKPQRTLSDNTTPRNTGAEPMPAPESMPPDNAPPPVDTRVVNGWLLGVSKQTPMQVDIPYELKFNVDQPRDDAVVQAGGGGAFGVAAKKYAAGKATVTVMVVIEPGDFTLYGVEAQEIIVPVEANIPAKNTVTFTIEASKTGKNTLKATLYINSNLFQQIEMTVNVGEQLPPGTPAVDTTVSGLTLPSAAALRPRADTINVVIMRKDPGYTILVNGGGGGVTRAYLDMSTEAVADWVGNARKALFDIVHMQDAQGNLVYQNLDTIIPPELGKASMQKLAEAGALLYYNLFENNNRADARAMGKLLTELSRTRQLHIQIVAERFFFPWSFLFDGDDAALETPSYDQFWGFKHVIEYLPEFTAGTLVNFDPNIAVGETVDMAFVCNNEIDVQFGEPVVQGQRDYFHNLPGLKVVDYPTVPDLIRLLRGPDSPPLIYFYCHAISKQAGEDGGADYSRISLSDAKVTIAEMKLKTRAAVERLRQAPVVFLNACESAELSPFLYDGWVPFLLSRGARGVLGTEVETPAFFAAEFAKEFVRRFAAGNQPLGELLRDLRVEYARDKHNIMGLLYALYSNGDVMIARG
ncbi:MAG: CHAT domain-containing protein [Kouleothrix sp.]